MLYISCIPSAQRWSIFPHSELPTKEFLVRYSCFQKPALRLLHTSYQLALCSHGVQVHASPGITG